MAAAGNKDAQYYLGGLYYKGEGAAQNYEEAASWFQKSADQGNPKAQTDLAQCYLLSYGVEKDSVVAIGWYRRAAAQGYAPAVLNLAAMLTSGTGSERDLVQAHVWATIAMSKFSGEDYESAARIRYSTKLLLPPAQFEEAQQMVREW